MQSPAKTPEKKEEEEVTIAIGHLCQTKRDCFQKILRRVKPALFAKGRQIPDQVNWAKVHLQCDMDSCGVHVLS
ncbi:hypothetical protein K1719_020483 [Acacia pycnantha]|nr:hypothetical protein K1719_043337 [Acacia pycnantha]KAI9108599.1 hypothetical protein K1719_020483 [Acacia pycnantha]